MRKIFSVLLLATMLILTLGAVRPALASPGGTMSGSIFIKNFAVTTTFNRAWDWSIAKTGSASDLTLSPGQTHLVNYNVTVTGTAVDSGWYASGSLAFRNIGSTAFDVVSVTVDFGDGIVVNANCPATSGFPPTVGAGETVNCTYATALPDGSNRTAVATVATTAGSASDSSAVTFGAPASETGQCINVDDSLAGFLGQVCASGSPTTHTFSYSYTVGPFNTCGLYTVDNTAAIRETGASDDWRVNINVPCGGGCTLTQGYWKTHSARGPAPYDPAWMNIGPLQEQTTFFLSGQTWHTVFWTAPAGNAYYVLAHQYMAAKLNVLDGASAPADVTAAIASAESLFNSIAPSGVTRANRAQFTSLAALLDDYNNGLIGPGHCSE